MAKKPNLIQSLARAFSIVDCFTVQEKELTLNEISERVDLNINTTRGLVQTLLYFHYLAYDSKSSQYRLGKIYLEKAEIAQFDITEQTIQLVRNDLQELADQFKVSARLISINDLSTSTVHESRPSRSRYYLTIHKQTDFPLYASATGKLILAYLDRDRFQQVVKDIAWMQHGQSTILDAKTLKTHVEKIAKDGISYETDELGDGYSSIAIPVFLNSKLTFSLSVVSTTQIIDENKEALIASLNDIHNKIQEHF